MLADGTCNQDCNNDACVYDMGDCGPIDTYTKGMPFVNYCCLIEMTGGHVSFCL